MEELNDCFFCYYIYNHFDRDIHPIYIYIYHQEESFIFELQVFYTDKNGSTHIINNNDEIEINDISSLRYELNISYNIINKVTRPTIPKLEAPKISKTNSEAYLFNITFNNESIKSNGYYSDPITYEEKEFVNNSTFFKGMARVLFVRGYGSTGTIERGNYKFEIELPIILNEVYIQNIKSIEFTLV